MRAELLNPIFSSYREEKKPSKRLRQSGQCIRRKTSSQTQYLEAKCIKEEKMINCAKILLIGQVTQN